MSALKTIVLFLATMGPIGKRKVAQIAALCLLIAATAAAGQPAVTVRPDQAPARAEVLIRASALPPGPTEFWLVDGRDAQLLGSNTSRRGSASLSATVPGWPEGAYAIEVRQSTALIASTPFTISGPGGLQLTPTEGPPGTWVSLHAEDLGGDVVSVELNGTLVIGPQPLNGSVFDVRFEVPDSGVPGAKTVALRTLRGETTIDLAQAIFTQLGSTPRAPPRIDNADLRFDPGTRLHTVSGILVPREGESLADYDISVIFAAANGPVVPLAPRADLDTETGAYSFQFRSPTLFDGDAIYAPGLSGDVIIAVITPENTGNGGKQQQGFQYTVGTITIQNDLLHPITIKLESLTGEAIEGAVVQLKAATPISVNPPKSSTGSFKQSAWLSATHGDYQGPLAALLDYPVEKCGFLIYKEFSDEAGEVTFSIDPIDIQAFMLDQIDTLCKPTGDPTSQKPECEDVNLEIPLILRISAVHQGYGWKVDGTWVGGIYAMMLRLQPQFGIGQIYGFYDAQFLTDEQLRDPDFSPEDMLDPDAFTVPINTEQPLLFKLPPIQQPPIPLPMRIAAPLHVSGLVPSGSGPTEKFVGVVSLKNKNVLTSADIFADDLTISFVNAEIEVPLKGVRLEVEGQDLGPFADKPANFACQANPLVGLDSTEYSAKIPAAMAYGLPKGGSLKGRVLATNLLDELLVKNFELKATEEAPAWINTTSDYTNRRVQWKPSSVRLSADEITRDAAITSPDLDYDVGTLENNTSNGGGIVQRISGLTGAGEISRMAMSSNEVASNNGEDQDFNGSATTNGTITVGPQTITILDTGKLPLFRYGWGIWPIASATIGADLWLRAELFYKTVIRLADSYYEIVAGPSADVQLDIFFDISMILDLVKATATASSSVNISVPVTTINGNVTTNECFQFDLDALYDISVGVCPFCVGASGIEPLIHEQSGCGPGAKSIGNELIPGGSGNRNTPPRSSPSLAFSQSGFGLLSHFDDSGQLAIQELVFGEPEASHLFPPLPGLMDVHVAFMDRENALAVAAMSGLSEAQFLASAFGPADSLVTRAQHIVSAEYVNGQWSSFAPLTVPGTGEGSPRLATCYDGTRTGCTSRQAIAVWVRDLAGDLGAYRTQVFYALYDDGIWSAPLAADGSLAPDSQVKDGQPAVAYWDNGSGPVPVVVWVRNPGGDMGDLHSRRLMYRVLDGAHNAETVPGLPAAVASPSIAADLDGGLVVAFTVAQDDGVFLGDQRTLHRARYSCDPACAWDWNEVLDAFGRAIKAERPQLVTDSAGTAAIVRVLGYMDDLGTPATRLGDPIGAVTGTGDLAKVYVHLKDTTIVQSLVESLTNDGLINWEVAAAFDPTTGVNVVASTGQAIGASTMKMLVRDAEAAARNLRSSGRTRLADSSAVMLRAMPGPDFAIVGMRLLGDPRPAESFGVEIELTNLGVPYPAALTSLTLELAWDGRLGFVGSVLAESVCTPVGSNILQCQVDMPSSFRADENHSLTASISREDRVADDLNDRNNHFTLQLGLLSPPQGIRVRSSDNDSFNYLSWQPSSDPRVVGYRIYRSLAGRGAGPIGSSLGSTWVDTHNASAGDFQYWVSSYSRNGVESPLSLPSAVALQDQRLFGDGFE